MYTSKRSNHDHQPLKGILCYKQTYMNGIVLHVSTKAECKVSLFFVQQTYTIQPLHGSHGSHNGLHGMHKVQYYLG